MENKLYFSSPLLQPDPCEPLKKRWDRNEGLLLRALGRGNVVAFLGSGVSNAFKYPTWPGLAFDLLAKTVSELRKESREAEARNIESFQEGAKRKGKKKLKAPELMFLIGACRAALDRNGLRSVYDNFFERHFAPRPGPRERDPLKSLLALPIGRFVTTNYDCEIERALADIGSVCSLDLGLNEKRHGAGMQARDCKASFTQDLDGLERLVRFALADSQNGQAKIFHCHGRYDQPRSVIATEDDYRQWYLNREQGASLAFQQNIELLFGSNPLLFIGYGLRDEDLLRPLRQFIALNPKRKGVRPLFALISSFSGEEGYHFASLFERFGLNVCPIPVGSEGETEALCRKLETLHADLAEMQRHASEKPKMRRTLPLQGLPNPHCEIDTIAAVPVPCPQDLADAVRKPGVVVLTGPSGTGKSHHLLKIVKSSSDYGFAGAFYWNAHYANESVTSIEAALSYFDPGDEGRRKETLYKRVVRCLEKARFLLVIDGCERLLRRNGVEGEGISYSATFHRLLEAIAHPSSQSTVVIAGRLRPADLDEIAPHGLIQQLHLHRGFAQELRGLQPFSQWPDRDRGEGLSTLSSLLRGHNYGLQLATKYLDIGPPWPAFCQRGCCLREPYYLEKADRLEDLNHRLENELRDERLYAMVEFVVDALDKSCGQGRGLARPFLERLGFFLNPVCETTLRLCFTQACQEKKVIPDDALRDSLHDGFVGSGLLIKMYQAIPRGGLGYTVHITVRSALFRSRQGVANDPLPAFGLSGFSSGRQGVAPSPDHCHRVRDLFRGLLQTADEHLGQDLPYSRELCRDAYNLIRTLMEANTASRWTSFDEYLQYGLRLAELVRRVTAGEGWSYCEYPDGWDLAESENAALYPAELAWLYNDIAIAYCAEGHVVEACAFWERTYEISRLIEDPTIGGGYHQEVLLSLAMAAIERGRLAAAIHYIEDAERILVQHPDDDYQARILGLHGLIAHLRGNLIEASDFYERSRSLLRTGNNLRAQSIILKHLADIKITTHQLEEADLLIRNSRALAESGVFPELVINARISEGHRLSRTGQPVQARLEYNAVLSEARRIGFRKMEVRALTALARLSLDQKDVDGARDQAMQAMSLANELGLGLRQPHCLVVLGLATLEDGQKDLGVAYLRLAKQMADGQGYWARSREAENKLRELGVPLQEEKESASAEVLEKW